MAQSLSANPLGAGGTGGSSSSASSIFTKQNVGMAALAGGTGLSIFGNIQANLAQSQAEEENAEWLEQQAEFAQFSTDRAEDIFLRETDQLLGAQIGGFNTSNVELSGSALDVINDTMALADREVDAIRYQGQMQVQEALLKASAARRNADRLGSFEHNLLQSAGTIAGASARFV